MSQVPSAVSKELMLELLQRAKSSSLGICIESTDPQYLKVKLKDLCKELRKGGDKSFDVLQFSLSQFSIRELWIHHGKAGRAPEAQGIAEPI